MCVTREAKITAALCVHGIPTLTSASPFRMTNITANSVRLYRGNHFNTMLPRPIGDCASTGKAKDRLAAIIGDELRSF